MSAGCFESIYFQAVEHYEKYIVTRSFNKIVVSDEGGVDMLLL